MSEVTDLFASEEPVVPEVIARAVDVYDALYGEHQAASAALQFAIDEVMAPVKASLDAINEGPLAQKVKELEERMKAGRPFAEAEVLARGATVKGTYVQYVYTPPGYKWDGKMLDGMLALIPQIGAARTVKEPSVSIRGVK